MKNASNTIIESEKGLLRKEISLIILRLELDDLNQVNESTEAQLLNNFNKNNTNITSIKNTNQEQQSYISNTSNPLINETLSFDTKIKSDSVQSKDNLNQKSCKEDSEDLRIFIGKRESRLFSIETYYFNKNNVETAKNTKKLMEEDSTNIQLVNNASTMQKALETAYNDWNKEKNCDFEEKLDSEKLDLKNEKEMEKDEQKLLNKNDKNDSKDVKVDLENTQKKIEQEMEKRSLLISSEFDLDKNKKKINESENISKANLSNKQNLTQITSEIAYMFGNPTVDLVKGFIHIYKSCNLTEFDEKLIDSSSYEAIDSIQLTQKRSEMLCMIGVPNSVTCNELLDFVMPFNENMQFMRILRDTHPNQYMVLIKFINQKDADLFYVHNDNKLFNSIEDNHCHLAFVERVETINSSKGAAKPIPGFTELPACYICLERMDESLNGVISILCNHSFHTNCLVKWGDTCCPVCRYSQTPDYADVDNACTECGSNENLWICLICGYIGCGRYAGGHAHNHFKETQHTYSMELGHNKVWDYAADNYVHRLIQNKSDGKMVQFDERNQVVNRDEKVDSITLEYTYLLTMQLDSQRLFFEERLNKMEDKSRSEIDETEFKLKEHISANSSLKENLAVLNKEKNTLEKKHSTFLYKFNKIQNDLNVEKELNKCLTTNQELYQSKLTNLEEKLKKSDQEKSLEIEDLQSQLRDVMFYLDAQSKMAKSSDVTSEEIQGSQMVIQQDEAATPSIPNLSNSAKMANRRKRK